MDELSGIQKAARFFSTKAAFQRMAEESKVWRFTCPCGKDSSVWEAGGIRAGAKGKPSVRIQCPHCGDKSMKSLHQEKG